MRNDPTVVALVIAARKGDRDAWNRIVERYAPLIWAICRRFQLSRSDVDDVAQTVWLTLVEHLATIREPAALAGWLATTTRNECLKVLRSENRRQYGEQLDDEPAAQDDLAELEHELERAQRQIALREAFAQLGPRCQELLSMLFRDGGPSYREIGARLGMKPGSIGPSRMRCLDELRRCPALAALIEAEQRTGNGSDVRGQHMVER